MQSLIVRLRNHTIPAELEYGQRLCELMSVGRESSPERPWLPLSLLWTSRSKWGALRSGEAFPA